MPVPVVPLVGAGGTFELFHPFTMFSALETQQRDFLGRHNLKSISGCLKQGSKRKIREKKVPNSGEMGETVS